MLESQAIAWHARIPAAIWATFFAIALLAMLGFGYQTGIAGSRRTWATAILVLSFSLMIALIADIDRPQSASLRVSQQPLLDLEA